MDKGAKLGLLCGFIFSLNQIIFQQDLYMAKLGNTKLSTFLASVEVMIILSLVGHGLEYIINRIKED